MSEREKFEKWMKEDGIEIATLSEKAAARKAWQAALSTRKPYGYGIVDKDGKSAGFTSYFPLHAIASAREGQWVKDGAYPTSAPHRVVELFYEEQS